MAIRTTIKKILNKAKDIGKSILLKGTIKDNPKNREILKRFIELKNKNLPEKFLEEQRKKTIKKFESY